VHDVWQQWQALFWALPRKALGLAGWLIALGLLFGVLERWRPILRRRFARQNLGQDVAYFFIGGLLPPFFTVLVAAAVVGFASGLVPADFYAWVGGWPLWLRVVAMVVLGDLAFYWAHRWSHEVGCLWRLHAVHHSPTGLDWLVNTRAHPLDLVFARVVSSMPMLVLGLRQPTTDMHTAIAEQELCGALAVAGPPDWYPPPAGRPLSGFVWRQPAGAVTPVDSAAGNPSISHVPRRAPGAAMSPSFQMKLHLRARRIGGRQVLTRCLLGTLAGASVAAGASELPAAFPVYISFTLQAVHCDPYTSASACVRYDAMWGTLNVNDSTSAAAPLASAILGVDGESTDDKHKGEIELAAVAPGTSLSFIFAGRYQSAGTPLPASHAWFAFALGTVVGPAQGVPTLAPSITLGTLPSAAFEPIDLGGPIHASGGTELVGSWAATVAASVPEPTRLALTLSGMALCLLARSKTARGAFRL
jgi:hypothetical protein